MSVQPGTDLGIGGAYRQGNFYLNADALNSGQLTALVAHELGHYVLGHEPTTGCAARVQSGGPSSGGCQGIVVTGRGRDY